MCGIGGILRTDGEAIPDKWLDAIDARIAWRGPDGVGRFRDRVETVDEHGLSKLVEVAFVHRRLSIIDHEDGGQPMVSEQGRDESEPLVAVVFNGCIYNHRELRVQLQSAGHRFATDHSDTEVLIHGWREWGLQLVEHVEGMYAFGLWDRKSARVLLAKDWFGEKPLYHSTLAPGTGSKAIRAFASTTDALLALEPAIKKEPASWENYLRTGYVEAVEVDGEVVRPHPTGYAILLPDGRDDYTARPLVSQRQPATEAEFEMLLERAVARRLEADVPLGCFLSGGVDSSLIAHYGKIHQTDLRTFSVRMPNQRFDESAHAQRAAQHLGTNHTTLEVAMNPAQDLIKLIELLGQPFGDSSILPTYWVSQAARSEVKVALSGDGGDELFLGYQRYPAAPVLAEYWRWLRYLPVSLFHRAHSKSPLHKLARLRDMARDYPKLGLEAMEAIFTQDEIDELVSSRKPRPLPHGRGSESASLALRFHDIDHYLPDDLLRKVDTASMACGLEVRCPFLDRDLARAALAMPIEQLMPGGQRKGLLRHIARKYLPGEIVDRPKMGFAIPIGEWFRTDFGAMKTLLLDSLHSTEPFGEIQLNQRAVQQFIDEHMAGKRDHGHRLFTLLTLSIWARQTQVHDQQ